MNKTRYPSASTVPAILRMVCKTDIEQIIENVDNQKAELIQNVKIVNFSFSQNGCA